MKNIIFITSTATDVGKTYISALIAKNLAKNGVNVGYFKPLASGNKRHKNGDLISDDAYFVKNFAGLKTDIFSMFGYAFKRAYSPHLAANFENVSVKKSEILEKIVSLSKEHEVLIVEGSGGAICPFGENFMQIDIIKELDLGVLLISNAGLGAINATILSTEYLKKESIKTKGIILNRYNPKSAIDRDNAVMIERLSGLAILAKVKDRAEKIDLNLKFG